MKHTDDIIRMAREAWNDAGEGWVVEKWFEDRAEALERFAQLVAAAEREACAEICDKIEQGRYEDKPTTTGMAWEAAMAIRARGNI